MLSKFEEDNLKQLLDEHGVSVTLRTSYHQFAWKIKGKKVQTKEDIEKVIREGKQKGLDEGLMKTIAKILIPELTYLK